MTAKRIVMYTKPGCEDSDAAREFLKQRDLPFEEVNIEQNRTAFEFVRRVNDGKQRTPTFEVGTRIFHCSPFDAQKLARELSS
jgi:glutaredoxin